MAEDELNDLSDQLKGTTAVAFFHKDTIKLIFDSRESNEAVIDREPHWKLEEAADYVEKYFQLLATSTKKAYNLGVIIAGFDKTKGLQIYRVYIVKNKVKNQEIDTFTCFGPGDAHANHILGHDYNFDSSDEDVNSFAHRVLFNASFFDKNTDGNINYVEVTENGYEMKEGVKALEAYITYYHHYDEASTLFLVHKDKKIIPTDDLIVLFRKHADIILSHCVDHRTTSAGKQFYFHRLVFASSTEAEKAWASLKDSLPNKYKTSKILSHFGYQVDCNGSTVFLQKASQQLLHHIISNSSQLLDFNTKLVKPLQI